MKRQPLILLLITALALGACEKKASVDVELKPTNETSTNIGREESAVQKQEIKAWWQSVVALAPNLNKAMTELGIRSRQLLRSPSPESLSSARTAWVNAYTQQQAMASLSYMPFVSPELFPQQNKIWMAVDPWPIAPGYIDGVGQYPFAGIVNDELIELSDVNIRAQHALTDPSEAVLGYLPLAYLLWSEDRSAVEWHHAFVKNGGGSANNASRRRQLLSLVVDGLKTDTVILNQWLVNSGRSSVAFFGLPSTAQLELIKRATAAQIRSRLISVLLDREGEASDGSWMPSEARSVFLQTNAKAVDKQLRLLSSLEFIDYQRSPALEQLISVNKADDEVLGLEEGVVDEQIEPESTEDVDVNGSAQLIRELQQLLAMIERE